MSKEFEKIVLEKLCNLETEVKDINGRLCNVEVEVKETKQDLKDLALKTNQRFDNLEAEVKQTKQDLKNLVLETNQRFNNLEMEVKDTQEVVKYLNQNFTKFDFEINKKIDTLFDAYSINKENIVSLNQKTFNHNTRINNLENKDRKLIKL